jgi:hypothetical protein
VFRVFPFLLAAMCAAAPVLACGPGFAVSTAGGGVYICPAGDGSSLEGVGAEVMLTMVDPDGHGVEGQAGCAYLSDDAAGLVPPNPPSLAPCVWDGFFAADGPTDADGVLFFRGTMPGGGHSAGPLWATIPGCDGLPVICYVDDPLPITVNSPDINGDGTVDLSDIGAFAIDFNVSSPGPDELLRCDFTHDGRLNLSDVAILAAHRGHGCP